MDKCEGDQLYGGGEEPCPFCNTEEFIEQHLDEEGEGTRGFLERWIAGMKEKYSKQ